MVQDLVVEYLNPAYLKRRANNPRTHSRRQIRQIAKSIKEFGFLSPILVDRQMQIVAGHGRADAAQLAGLDRVPTLRVDHLSPAQIRAYVIADNKLAENAAWDRELLLLEIKELEGVNFEITLLGFDDVELDVLMGGLDEDAERLDQVSLPERGIPATSRRDDLWLIGPHRLLCGDATSAKDFDTLMAGAQAQCVFTDPPYNVRINGHASGLGKFKHEEFPMAAGEMTALQFSNFLELSFRNLTNHTIDGSIHFVCMDWRHMKEILAAGTRCYSELKNLCVWVKPNGGMGSLYRSRHELVFVFKNGSCAHLNNVSLGKNGRNRTNVWEYVGASSFGVDRDANLAAHPTVKPVAMVADAILDCSNRGDLILEPFAGSGTTLVAAHRMGRRVCAMELDPYYVDAIIKRVQAAFGLDANLAGCGLPFTELNAKGITTRSRELQTGQTIGGVPFTRGPLGNLLKNRIYVGEITHKGQSYPGEHEAIIDRALFEAVQAKLAANLNCHDKSKSSSGALLLGRLFDDAGNLMSPTHARKGSLRYRYYVSRPLVEGRKSNVGSVCRVSADQIETIVSGALQNRKTDAPNDIQARIESGVERVILGADDVQIEFKADGAKTRPPQRIPWIKRPRRAKREVLRPVSQMAEPKPIRSARRATLLRAVALGRRWLQELVSGKVADPAEIASREGRSTRSVYMTVSLAFLDPALVEAAVAGRLPHGIGTTRLMGLPASWAAQWKVLGLVRPN